MIRRKLLLLLSILAIVFGVSTTPTFADDSSSKQVLVFLDGLPITFDAQPFIQNDRTFVPIWAVADALHVKYTWEQDTQTVSASNGHTNIQLQIGNTTVYKDGKAIELDVAPLLQQDRTYVPLRFFTEAFGCQLNWQDGDTFNIYLKSAPKSMNVIGYYALGDSTSSSWKNLFGTAYPTTATGNTDVVSGLALGWYTMDKGGNLLSQSSSGWQKPDGWQDVLKSAAQYKLSTQMVIHSGDQDGTLTALVADEAAMNHAVSGIVSEAKSYQGVNLDLEGLGETQTGDDLVAVQHRFTHFVQMLSVQLHQQNKMLALSLHPLNSVYKGYDYSALANYADQLIVMAYDYGSVPEPDDLVRQSVELALGSGVSPDKLILGISTPDETSASILTKIGIAKRYNLNGIALWRLGLVTNDMWNSIKSAIQLRSASQPQ